MGWVHGNGPKMVAVQSTGCAPVVSAVQQQQTVCDRWQHTHTVADGLRVPKPLADTLILETIYESRGSAVAVNEDKIQQTMRQLACSEGILGGPEGAATLLAVAEIVNTGLASGSDRILVINTATGLKYHELIEGRLEHISKDHPLTL